MLLQAMRLLSESTCAAITNLRRVNSHVAGILDSRVKQDAQLSPHLPRHNSQGPAATVACVSAFAFQVSTDQGVCCPQPYSGHQIIWKLAGAE
jgi:hypothetical protein